MKDRFVQRLRFYHVIIMTTRTTATTMMRIRDYHWLLFAIGICVRTVVGIHHLCNHGIHSPQHGNGNGYIGGWRPNHRRYPIDKMIDEYRCTSVLFERFWHFIAHSFSLFVRFEFEIDKWRGGCGKWIARLVLISLQNSYNNFPLFRIHLHFEYRLALPN